MTAVSDMTAAEVEAAYGSEVLTREERLQALADLAVDGDGEASAYLDEVHKVERARHGTPTHVEEVLEQARIRSTIHPNQMTLT